LIFVTLPLLVYFAVAGRSKFLNDADTYWHIAVGRITLDSGLVTEDHFSFTRNGEPWIANQWLAECALAVAHSLGGLDGVLVLTITVLTATYLALAYRWLARGFDPVLTLAFLAFIISASAYTLNARPHVVSIGLLACVLALLRNVEDGRTSIARLAWLIPLFILWSNLHGGVLGGLGSLLIVATAWTLLWLLGMATPIASARDATLLWLIITACVFALLATPYGIGSLKAWLAIMSMSLPDLIIEHAPLKPTSPQGMLAILLCVVYLAVFASTPRAWLRPTFWLPLVWFLLTCQRIRHAPLFAMTAGIALADLLPQSRLAPWLAGRHWLRTNLQCPPEGGLATEGPTLPTARFFAALRFAQNDNSLWRANTLHVAAIVLIVSLPLFAAAIWLKHVGTLPLVGASWARPTSRVWPEDLLPTLTSYAAAHPHDPRVFNEPILGGFLIQNFPTLRVFIDGRCELYGESFLHDFVAAWRDPSRVREWQSKYQFRAALIEAKSPLRSYFDNDANWQLIAESPAARFYQLQRTAASK
jgi:hypothetical protein